VSAPSALGKGKPKPIYATRGATQTPRRRGRLLIFATRRATEQARRLLPASVVLETAVEQAIRDGQIRRGPRPSGRATAYGGDWKASLRRIPSPLTGRKAWLIESVERAR
jgi:hypothetical protein